MVFFALHSHFEQLSVCVYSVRQNYKTQQCSITSQMISIAHVYMFFAKFLEWQDGPQGMFPIIEILMYIKLISAHFSRN